MSSTREIARCIRVSDNSLERTLQRSLPGWTYTGREAIVIGTRQLQLDLIRKLALHRKAK